jgi:ubiquinone/menaquinone biosynthesis C-methylase UbiE
LSVSAGREKRVKRAIGAFYSVAADKIYEPLIVHGTFPLLAGSMPKHVREQGRRAVLAAGGRPILDIPIGTAYYTVPTAREHPGIVVGADYAAGMVRHSEEVAAREGLSNLVLVQADIHRLPFPDDAFAAILCTNGLQVIPGLRPSLFELARVLSPGGTLFLSVITLPASRVLPHPERSPTWLQSGATIASAVEDAGLRVHERQRARMATILEASKPEPALVRGR